MKPFCIMCGKNPAVRVTGNGKYLPCKECRYHMDKKDAPYCFVCKHRPARDTEDGFMPCAKCTYQMKENAKQEKVKHVSWDDTVLKFEEIMNKHHAGILPKSYYDDPKNRKGINPKRVFG